MLPGRTRKSIFDNSPAAALDYEIAQEKAAALGRLGRRLESALLALAQFDQVHAMMDEADALQRRVLVADAGQALWHFVVQRESCGLRDSRQVMRDYRVPSEVQYRMGISEQTLGARKVSGVKKS
jgi:hypothetical protein